MTTIADDIAQVWREYTTYGVSASGANEPVKQEIRALMLRVDVALVTLGVAAGGAITVKYATLTQLEADLDHAEGTLAIVYDDDRSPSESGIYAKVGASGTGSWELTDVALPADFSADLALALSQLEQLQDALTRAEAAAVAAASSAFAAAVSETNAAGSAVLAEYWANIAEASAFGPFLTDLSDVDAVNAYLQANAGQTIRVFAAPGPYHEPNFLATGDPIIVPANTCLLADGIVEIRSDNPSRQVFHLEGDGAKILGNFRLIGDYIPIGEYAWQDGSDFFNWSSGSQTSRPNFEWAAGEYTPWALAWNEAHPDFPITAYAVATWEAAWNAAMPQSQYANLGALSKNNRTAAITSYDASSLIVDGPYISNFHTSVTFQGNDITAFSAADTPRLQTYGNILRNLTLDQFDFGILCKKQRDFNIDGIKTEWPGWRVNRGQPHLIYLSNSTDVYEESWNVSVGTVYAVNYEGGSVFKARGCKNLTWGAILCRSVHSAIAIVEACTGSGGTVLITDQHQTTDPEGAGSKFACNITNSPGFIVQGAVRIQQRDGEDQMKGISIENSSGARFLQGSEVICARATDEDFIHRVRDSSYVYSGVTKYTDTNGRNTLLWTMSDSQEEGGNASSCVLEFGQITGTTKLARFVGLSANNQVWVDPTKVEDWNQSQALNDDGLGGGNVLIDPRATARTVVDISSSINLSLKASSTLTIEREGPDPLDEDALPPPYLFSDGDTVTFAGRTYIWRDVLSTGPTVANEILIPSATIVAAYPLMTAAYGYLQIAFLNAAVFAGDPSLGVYKGAGEGVIYSTGTVPHALVESEWGGNQFNIRALDGGAAPNAYTTTVSMTGSHASWTGATMAGGGDPDETYLNVVLSVTAGANGVYLVLPDASTVTPGNRARFVKDDSAAGYVYVRDESGATISTIKEQGRYINLSPDTGTWTPEWAGDELSGDPADVRDTTLTTRSTVDENLYFLAGNIGMANAGALRAERVPFSALKTNGSNLDVQADDETWQIVDPAKTVRDGFYNWNLKANTNKIYDASNLPFGEIFEFCTGSTSTSTIFLGTEAYVYGLSTAGQTIDIPASSRIALRRQSSGIFQLIDYTPTTDGAFRYASIVLSVGLNDTPSANLFAINRLDSSAGAGTRIRTPSASGLADGTWAIYEKSSTDTNYIQGEVFGSGTDVFWLTYQGDRVTMRVRSGAWEIDSWAIAPRFDLYTSTGSNTWTKPPLATNIEGQLIPGGAGGGSGRCGNAGAIRGGGNGGNGASLVRFTRKASDLDSSVTVTVGAGGAGGASTSTDGTSNAGAAGGVTTFGSSGAIYYAYTIAPAGGLAGGTGTNTQTAVTFQGLNAATGAAGSSTGAAGSNSGAAWGMGGASGGGITAANAYSAGGIGRTSINGLSNAAGTAGGAGVAGGAGGDAAAPTAQVGGFHPAPSGGGGGSGEGGGRGGNGGGYGGAGGGGGASLTGTASGKGGDGANGAALIITYFGG